MTNAPLDEASINIPCPQCGHTFGRSVGWIKRHTEFACPGCGAAIDAKQFVSEFKKVDKSIADFQQTLKRAGRRLKR